MAKAKLPATIIAGPHTYAVTANAADIARAALTEKALLNGHTDFAALVITLDPGLAVSLQAETLLHECLHIASEHTGLAQAWGPDKDEDAVKRLAPFLLDVLRRNPALVAYLTGTG